MAKLIVTTKALAGLSFELDSHWVTIGRAATSKFAIPHASVSGHHCEVLARGDELLVRDMRSTNGTFIQGAMVTEGVVKLGENFRVGEVDIWFEPSEPTPPPPPRISIYGKPTAPAPRPTAPTESAAAKKHQVLLVDDSMAFLETVGEVFESLSNRTWEIHRAASADQALALLQQHPIELAVLDINMPMLDGVQLLRVIQRRHPGVKQVVLTGQPSDVHRANSLANGAELFLEKPTTPNGITSIFNLLNDLFTWNQRDGFSGTLRQVGLTDVIQIECLRRGSCLLEVHNFETHGVIYIEAGAIVHATAGTLVGEKALFRLLGLRNGEFRMQTFQAPPERSIAGSWEYLLMEAARQSDENRLARPEDDTLVITKPNTDTQTSAMLGSNRSAITEDNSFKELGEDIVVVSTYDGKWHPVEGSKR